MAFLSTVEAPTNWCPGALMLIFWNNVFAPPASPVRLTIMPGRNRYLSTLKGKLCWWRDRLFQLLHVCKSNPSSPIQPFVLIYDMFISELCHNPILLNPGLECIIRHLNWSILYHYFDHTIARLVQLHMSAIDLEALNHQAILGSLVSTYNTDLSWPSLWHCLNTNNIILINFGNYVLIQLVYQIFDFYPLL